MLLLHSVTMLLCHLMRREAGEEPPEAPGVVGVRCTGLQEIEGTGPVWFGKQDAKGQANSSLHPFAGQLRRAQSRMLLGGARCKE